MNEREITLGPDVTVRLPTFYALAASEPGAYRLAFSDRLERNLSEVPARLATLKERKEAVYGITTGFGPLVDHGAPADSAHQEHLLEHLASGVGPDLPPIVVRASMLERLITLSKGASLCRRGVLEALGGALSAGFLPAVPALGSVGASGDLTPLAHLARALLGVGDALREGRRVDAGSELRRLGLTELSLGGRDGLALVNGTSTSTALAILSWWGIAALLPPLLASAALLVRALGLPTVAYDDRLHRARGQEGQIAVAEALRAALDRCRGPGSGGDSSILQAAYSFRCIPQILGPPLESLRWGAVVLERELNGVTDNPYFDPESGAVLHGGNFHGHAIAQVADQLALAVGNAAVLMDRQIARVTDPLLNGDLPPFLSPERIGPNSGFMGAQVTATALTEWLCSSAGARSMLHSRSTNAANQDVVSMSTGAGWRLYESVDRFRELVAIHCLVSVQATELSGVRDRSGLTDLVREISPPLGTDRSLSADIRAIAEKLLPAGDARPVLDLAWEILFPDLG